MRWIGSQLFLVGTVLVCGGGCAVEASEEVAIGFSQFREEAVASRRAVVRFDTSVETSCELQFGPSQRQLARTATDPDMDPNNPYAVEHEVPLEDLPPDTQIYYRAVATTRAGRTDYSEVRSFRTQAEGTGPDAGIGSLDWDQMVNVANRQYGALVAEVSSNFGGAADDEPWGGGAALDGAMATEWSTNGDGDSGFLVVQLPEAVMLQGYGFRSRKMADGSSIVLSTVLLTDDGTRLGPYASPNPDEVYRYRFEPPVMARTVRVQIESSTGGNTGAREIQLYALSE